MTEQKRPLVMSVEDNPDTQQLIQRLLDRAGYEVSTSENGVKGLESLVMNGTRPDLILLDIMMPEMNGYDFCAKLQENEELSYIPVVFLTALGEEQDKARAFAVGAVDYLTKPIVKDRLLLTIQKHLQTNQKWKQFQFESKKIRAVDFIRFKQFLFDELNVAFAKRDQLADIPASHLYSLANELSITRSALAKYLADFLNLSYHANVNLTEVQLGVLPAPFCRKNNVLAIKDGTETSFVLSNPFNLELIDHLNSLVGQGQLIITEPDNIAAIFQGAGTPGSMGAAGVQTMKQATSNADLQERMRRKMESTAPTPAEQAAMSADETEESEPIIMFVNQMIEGAYSMGASDVHVEPWEHEIVIRYRIDGDLRIVNRITPHKLIYPIIARIKIMSNLDIAERRMPQDGRIVFKKFTKKNLDFDLRVATSPMNYGEKAVLRILDKTRSALPLEQLGFSDRHLTVYKEKILTPYGMILHVGPTGSGKSMTLYAAINEVKRPEINVQTAEDPIEYTIPGINQLQTHRDIGLTFATALRSYLRQDPNVLLVGEIRDLETAQIAVEASLTGHLLLSTLHTNDASSAITRLVEMGIEPFLVSSTITCIVAQRLLRRLCADCKEAYDPPDADKALLGIPAGRATTIFRRKGCKNCNGIGYKGRIGTHEILVPDEEMRHMITQTTTTSEVLKRMAVERCNMTTLWWDAMEKVRDGITSLEDVLAKIRADDFDSRPLWLLQEFGIEPPKDRSGKLF